MPTEQIVIGLLIVLVCVNGVWKERWLLENSKKGQWLVRRFGPQRAVWVLRMLLSLGAIFGLLLATNVIHPIRW